jgi:hypothetical protein
MRGKRQFSLTPGGWPAKNPPAREKEQQRLKSELTT